MDVGTCRMPNWMLMLACSGNVAGTDNLAPVYYDTYVDYLTEVDSTTELR